MSVLRSDTCGCVDHEQRNIRPFDGFERTQNAILLHAMFDLALADSRCVDQRDLQAIHVNFCVGRAARRTRDGTDNGALFADQLIQQAGLAGVGFADDGDLNAIVFLLRGLFGKSGYQRIEQIACPCPVYGGNRIWFTQPQLVELRRRVPLVLCFGLVHNDKYRRPEYPSLQFFVSGAGCLPLPDRRR